MSTLTVNIAMIAMRVTPKWILRRSVSAKSNGGSRYEVPKIC